MGAITSENIVNAIMKLVSVRVLPALQSNLVMGNIVTRDFEPVLNQAGDTVNVPIPPTMVANNIAETGTVQAQNPTAGNAQIRLSTHAEATFTIPDVVKVLSNLDLMDLYMQPAIIALAEKIEGDILSLYALFTANAVIGGATAYDEARVDAAETALFNAKVPAGQQKYLVVSGNSYGAIRQITRFTEMQTSGNGQAIINGQVGMLKNFMVLRSQLVKYVVDRYKSLAFHPSAIGLAVRRLPMPLPGTGAIAQYVELGGFGMRVVMSYQPNTLAQQFTVDTLYGAGVLRNNFAQVIDSL